MNKQQLDEIEGKEKLTWMEKIAVRRLIKKGLKNIKETRKKRKEEKELNKLEEDRQRMITSILTMGDVFELYQDEECTIPATKEFFEEKDIDYLLNYLEEMLEMTRVRINEN